MVMLEFKQKTPFIQQTTSLSVDSVHAWLALELDSMDRIGCIELETEYVLAMDDELAKPIYSNYYEINKFSDPFDNEQNDVMNIYEDMIFEIEHLLDDLIHCELVAAPHDCNFDKVLAIQTLLDVDTCHFAHMLNLVARFLANLQAVYSTDVFDDI